MKNSVYIGWDPTQDEAYKVAAASLARRSAGYTAEALRLDTLRADKKYWRPTENRHGQLWDLISDAPMSTEFAISRFLVPQLATSGWALFVDCDVLFRDDVRHLFALADPAYAVMCVKHNFDPDYCLKMDSKLQVRYARKFWSSVMLINCDHPANRKLTLTLVNSVPGRDLHRFCWLADSEIGELGQEWNWLVGHSDPAIDARIVHFTDGTPAFSAHKDDPYADEWRSYL